MQVMELAKEVMHEGVMPLTAVMIACDLLDRFDITPKVEATPEQQEVMRARLG